MKYDFDKIINRRGTDAFKWDIGENELPMWVADMDFETAPEIIAAMQKRLDHGIFGYTDISDRWRDAYANWWDTRHGLGMNKQRLMFCTGVIPAISSIVRKLTTPNENVVIQTPVYHVFYNSICNNGCRVLESPLQYQNGVYSMDLADLEKCFSKPQTTLMILCNPHNPVGKIWERSDLAAIGELAKKHHVTVIADEIHCDLTEPGYDYIPFASVSPVCEEVSITCIAPTKTFNLAGLKTAAIYVPDRFLYHKVWRAINTDEVAEPNVFAHTAAIAAFEEGGPWLDQLREYLSQNRKLVEETVDRNIPDVHVVRSKATYLLWIDLSVLKGKGKKVTDHIRKRTGLFLSDGISFGPNGEDFARMNIACPRVLIEDGLKRLEEGIASYRAEFL
ncbi:MAG: pyridoxal phosphate-dependent aminotransferase [Lachnospiraceae bacterium]|nr:pyridoxal phosphate-dependent aminotransferase [Lachnospiraceae bacterium]